MKTFSALPLLPSPLSKEGGLWEDTSIPMPQEKLKIEKHWHFVLLQPLSLSHLLLPSFSFFFFLRLYQMHFYFFNITLNQPSTLPKFNSLLRLQDSYIILVSSTLLVEEGYLEFELHPLLCLASYALDMGL